MLSRTGSDERFEVAFERAMHTGTVTLIVGCMFSGKTTELLRRLRALPADRVVAFKHGIDRRYRPDQLVTHQGDMLPCVPVTAAVEMLKRLGPRTDTVAIDEAHFFAREIVFFARELAAKGRSVVLTALDLDSWGRPFPVIEELGRMADAVVKLQAACGRCGQPADRTQRLTPIVDENLVGGPESYEPRCAGCWQAPPEPPPE